MSNVSIVASDLVNKIGAIAAFGGRVAMTLGGTEADPTLSQIEKPYAWVTLTRSLVDSQDRERWTKARHNFTVYVGLDYGMGESNFVEQQIPLVESICQAVTGTQVNAPGPVKWAFDGLSLQGIDSNVAYYALEFSIVTFYTQST